MKKNIGKVAALALAVLIAPACVYAQSDVNSVAISRLESIKERYLASVRSEALHAKNAVPARIATGPASSWMKRVNANEVNMVTNRFERKQQNEISLNGKVYFATGEGYAFNMTQNPSLRFAKDPMTNKAIDKAEAVIYSDASGRAHYFESEETYKNFISLATPETVYGYSEAR